MRLPLLSVALLAACSGPPGSADAGRDAGRRDAGTPVFVPPQCFAVGPPPPFLPGQVNRDVLPYLGVPADLTVFLPKFFRCDGGEPTARSVHTQLYSPENLPVAHEVGALMSHQEGYSAQVRFTPDASGSYHLSARFEPSLGTAQVDLFPIIDRAHRPADPSLSIPGLVSGGCTRFWLTSRNAVLCTTNGGQVALFRGGQLEHSLTATHAAVVDDVIWVSQGASVARYLDTGSGRLEGPLAGSSPVQVLALAGGRADVVAVGQSSAHRLAPSADGGGLEALEAWTYDAGPYAPVAAARSGSGLVVGAHGDRVCRGAQPGPLECSRNPNQSVIAAGPDGLWTSSLSIELHRWTPSGHTVLPTPFFTFGGRPSVEQRPVIEFPRGELFGMIAGDSSTFVEWTRDGGWAPVTVHGDWAAFRHRGSGDIELVRY